MYQIQKYIFFLIKAQFKRRAIVVSNLIELKLDCRRTVDLNVEFNLVVPDSTDPNVECMHLRQVHWDNGKIIYYHN